MRPPRLHRLKERLKISEISGLWAFADKSVVKVFPFQSQKILRTSVSDMLGSKFGLSCLFLIFLSNNRFVEIHYRSSARYDSKLGHFGHFKALFPFRPIDFLHLAK